MLAMLLIMHVDQTHKVILLLLLLLLPCCSCCWDLTIEARSNRDNCEVAVGVMGLGET
jgi:hypothetical protein